MVWLLVQIARAAAIFHVDEVVIYGDPSVKGGRGNWDATPFFARLLQYVETPQYLRKVCCPLSHVTLIYQPPPSPYLPSYLPGR